MKTPAGSRPARTALAFLLLVALSAAARPQTQDTSDFEKRIAGIQGQIKQLRARLEAEARKEQTLISALAQLNLTRSVLQNELAVQYIQVERTESELKAMQKKAREVESRLDAERAVIERILVTMHKFGKPDFARFVLRAENFESVSRESKRLMLLARYQEQVVSGYLATLSELEAARAALEEKKQDLAGQIRMAEFKRRELDEERRKNTALVARIRQNKVDYEKAVEELKESAEQLQVLMKKIETNEWVLTGPFVPLTERKGKLAWPVQGRLITGFGLEVHPRFKTIVMNKGIEIEPRTGSATVQAVHAGKVVFTDYFPGYGNLIIIDHGLTYYSLYGHCSEFLVRAGDMVSAGQPIAVTGDTGSLKGECLYFEIRYRARAIDPLQWLKRK
jgi:septal ring factor EnvC (AmiA/AmiB activator)